MRTRIEPLSVRAAIKGDLLFMVKHLGGMLPPEQGVIEASVQSWQCVAVLSGGHGKLRLFVLEPTEEQNELKFHDCWVRGHFQIVQKINNAKAARLAWDTFRAS